MIPPSFEYLTPSKISDAIAMLQKHGEEAKILAGGHSLIPAMRLRLSEPGYLIDISGIQGLDYILEESGQLRIGAMTREASLEESQNVRENFPILLDTVKMIADPSVRNLATVGGNLAHGDPANDHPATMLALGAIVVVEGPNGSREIGIDELEGDIAAIIRAEGDLPDKVSLAEQSYAGEGSEAGLYRENGEGQGEEFVAGRVTLESAGPQMLEGTGTVPQALVVAVEDVTQVIQSYATRGTYAGSGGNGLAVGSDSHAPTAKVALVVGSAGTG